MTVRRGLPISIFSSLLVSSVEAIGGRPRVRAPDRHDDLTTSELTPIRGGTPEAPDLGGVALPAIRDRRPCRPGRSLGAGGGREVAPLARTGGPGEDVRRPSDGQPRLGLRCLDAEDRVIRGDPAELFARGGRINAAEELADFPLPPPEVGAKDRLLVGVRDLRRNEALAFSAEQELPFTGDAQVAHPLGMTAWGDEVSGAFERQHVDRQTARLAALATTHLEHAGTPDTDPETRQRATSRLKTLRVNQLGTTYRSATKTSRRGNRPPPWAIVSWLEFPIG